MGDINFAPNQGGLPIDVRSVPYTAGDDEEECALCGSRYAQQAENGADMSWIGCSYETCGKWYHQVCIGMPDDEYRRVTENEDHEWFCTDACRASHLNISGERATAEKVPKI